MDTNIIDELESELAALDTSTGESMALPADELLALGNELDALENMEVKPETQVKAEPKQVPNAPKRKPKATVDPLIVRTSTSLSIQERLEQLMREVPHVFDLVEDEPAFTVERMTTAISALPVKAQSKAFSLLTYVQGGRPSTYIEQIMNFMVKQKVDAKLPFAEIRASLEHRYPRKTSDPNTRNVLAALKATDAVFSNGATYALNPKSRIVQRFSEAA